MSVEKSIEVSLSDDELKSDQEYRKAIRVVEQNKKPSKFLMFVMNLLERYRQKRKMGWSRPQNKYGLNVFASYYLFKQEDKKLLSDLKAIFDNEVGDLSFHKRFVDNLFNDDGLMGFIFCHDYEQDGSSFEGFTLSLGRKSVTSARFRDRLDFIFESKLVENKPSGFSKIRVYVDPFIEPIATNPSEFFEVQNVEKYNLFFETTLQSIEKWENTDKEKRSWEHWTARYIDYFGPRKLKVKESNFEFLSDSKNFFENELVRKEVPELSKS